MGGLLPARRSEQEEMTKTNLKETATPQLSCLVSIQRDNVQSFLIVQELRESRGGRPGLSVLTSLLVSVDVKIY